MFKARMQYEPLPRHVEKTKKRRMPLVAFALLALVLAYISLKTEGTWPDLLSPLLPVSLTALKMEEGVSISSERADAIAETLQGDGAGKMDGQNVKMATDKVALERAENVEVQRKKSGAASLQHGESGPNDGHVQEPQVGGGERAEKQEAGERQSNGSSDAGADGLLDDGGRKVKVPEVELPGNSGAKDRADLGGHHDVGDDLYEDQNKADAGQKVEGLELSEQENPDAANEVEASSTNEGAGEQRTATAKGGLALKPDVDEENKDGQLDPKINVVGENNDGELEFKSSAAGKNKNDIQVSSSGHNGESGGSRIQESVAPVSATDDGSCDLYHGSWIRGRPLYSGKRCSILASHWACRNSARKSFDYENWRWQPSRCDLPAFSATDFLDSLRNKTVVIMGDSLCEQQYQSLMCMLSGGNMEQPNIANVSSEYNFYRARFGGRRFNGTAWRFLETNTTLINKVNHFLGRIEYYNSSYRELGGKLHIDQLDSWLVDNFWRIDVLVLNTGHHWGWTGFKAAGMDPTENGKSLNVPPPRKKRDVKELEYQVVRRLLNYLDKQVTKRKGRDRPLVFFRALSPRHFVDGDWNTGGRCDNVKEKLGEKEMAKRPVRDMDAENAMKGLSNIRLLNITYLSQFRGEAHLSLYSPAYNSEKKIQDCLHWCLPGVPDVWNEILYAEILRDCERRRRY